MLPWFLDLSLLCKGDRSSEAPGGHCCESKERKKSWTHLRGFTFFLISVDFSIELGLLHVRQASSHPASCICFLGDLRTYHSPTSASPGWQKCAPHLPDLIFNLVCFLPFDFLPSIVCSSSLKEFFGDSCFICMRVLLECCLWTTSVPCP